MPALNQDIVSRIPLLLPDLNEQRAIAHVLGTLDDKIELNRKMNETLEAMARAIFKSWFVDFDPVRAKTKGRQPVGISEEIAALFPDSFKDSALGEIPDEWEVQSLPAVIEVNPKRLLKRGHTAPYLPMKNMPTSGHYPGEIPLREYGSGTRFQNGDTLLARITPCLENGKTAYIDFLESDQVGWGSTEYIVLRAKPPLPTCFAYFLARDPDFRAFVIQHMTGSSGRQRVPADGLNHYVLPVPNQPIASAFGLLVAPLMEKVRTNCEQMKTLADIRDALLPKLLCGDIRVGSVHELVSEVV